MNCSVYESTGGEAHTRHRSLAAALIKMLRKAQQTAGRREIWEHDNVSRLTARKGSFRGENELKAFITKKQQKQAARCMKVNESFTFLLSHLPRFINISGNFVCFLSFQFFCKLVQNFRLTRGKKFRLEKRWLKFSTATVDDDARRQKTRKSLFYH